MSDSGLPRGPHTHDDVVMQALPWATKQARRIARIYNVRSTTLVKDAEQIACQIVVEKRTQYDESRGPLEGFLWRPVTGAVHRLLQRELSHSHAGIDDALDEAGSYRAPVGEDDPFAAEDATDLGVIKGACRQVTFKGIMGGTRVALRAQPENALLRAEAFKALRVLLGDINEREAQVVDLYYWQELTWDQVGERLGISDRHAKRIEKALRDRLEAGLASQGVEEPPPSSGR